MKRRNLSSLVAAGFAALFYGPSPAVAQPYLGANLSPFAVLAGSTVTCTGPGTITGQLGLTPGTSVTGFPPCVSGVQHVADATALLAQNDLTTAFTTLGTLPCGLDLTGTDLGGLTLTPGVYCFSTSAQLTGILTLNGLGDPNAVWVFKIGSTLTTASGSSVVFINGGTACEVQWRVGSSATIGTTTNFAGNILAQDSITLNTNASVVGRALARTGAVTLDGNNLTNQSVCASAPGPPPFPGPAPTPLPSPVPTLPEIGAWALLVVLLGSGAYLLSRRTPTDASR